MSLPTQITRQVTSMGLISISPISVQNVTANPDYPSGSMGLISIIPISVQNVTANPDYPSGSINTHHSNQCTECHC